MEGPLELVTNLRAHGPRLRCRKAIEVGTLPSWLVRGQPRHPSLKTLLRPRLDWRIRQRFSRLALLIDSTFLT